MLMDVNASVIIPISWATHEEIGAISVTGPAVESMTYDSFSLETFASSATGRMVGPTIREFAISSKKIINPKIQVMINTFLVPCAFFAMATAIACIPPILLITAIIPPTARINNIKDAFQESATVPTKYVSQVRRKPSKIFPPLMIVAPANTAAASDNTTCLVINDKTIAINGVIRESAPKYCVSSPSSPKANWVNTSMPMRKAAARNHLRLEILFPFIAFPPFYYFVFSMPRCISSLE